MSCRHFQTPASLKYIDTSKAILVDSTFSHSEGKRIKLISDKYFSEFETQIECRFFYNYKCVDSVIASKFDIISWYSQTKDSIDLVAHVGQFETSALLLRFVHGIVTVYFFRAAHENQQYFRVSTSDSFCSELEVPATQYRLQLSKILTEGDTSVIFGHIDMESDAYFDKRDSIAKPRTTRMKFYFRSQVRKFNY